jgi:16S rRNA (guanine1207-N2)-methyltransferase
MKGAEGIHRAYPYLRVSESPSRTPADLIYPAYPLSTCECKKSALVVDYDLARINQNKPDKWECCELEDVVGSFNRVVIRATQYDSPYQIQRDVLAASKLLSPRGELRVVAALKGGPERIGSVIAQYFRSVHKVTAKDSSLFICRKPSPKEPPPEPVLTYHDAVSDKDLQFYVRPGMFSSSNIDKGTELLLQTIKPVVGKSVLDVGCGSGVIGVVAAARGASVSLLDVDARAIKLAKRNIELNGYRGDTYLALQPYECESNRFDIVLSNPPTHSGSKTLQQLFAEMVRVSKEQVVIVIREHLNYEKWLVKLGHINIMARTDGYKIIQIQKV